MDANLCRASNKNISVVIRRSCCRQQNAEVLTQSANASSLNSLRWLHHNYGSLERPHNSSTVSHFVATWQRNKYHTEVCSGAAYAKMP